MLSVDPAAWARRQLAADLARTARFSLFERKAARMAASPLAFLRGAAPLFYELLLRHPSLARGGAGKGWLVGDAHLENFGAFRTGTPAAVSPASRPSRASRHAGRDDRVVFDVNDFDDAFVGPWRFDVLRLATSLLLGGRNAGADGARVLAWCDSLVDAYVGAAFDHARAPSTPHAVSALVERVQARTRRQLLEARTEVVGGLRRFVRGERYAEVDAKTRRRAERAFAKYARRLPEGERPSDDALEVIDVAFRVAGTGSLGCLRLAVLARGKGGPDGAFVFDLKEEGEPSSSRLVRPPKLDPAARVSMAMLACLAHPPRMVGTTELGRASIFARRLAPQEDRVDLAQLRPRDFESFAPFLGSLLGAAHARGRKGKARRAWRAKERRALVDSAVALAGIHEGVYLAYCDLVRRRSASSP